MKKKRWAIPYYLPGRKIFGLTIGYKVNPEIERIYENNVSYGNSLTDKDFEILESIAEVIRQNQGNIVRTLVRVRCLGDRALVNLYEITAL
jgi:hypothetical protein